MNEVSSDSLGPRPDRKGPLMAKSKRPPEVRTNEPRQPDGQDPPIPDELKGVKDLTIRAQAGKPAAYAFSLEFPATLTAIVRSDPSGGFSAEVPALPGCFTEGETLDELRENLREASEGWLEAHHELLSQELAGEPLDGIEKR
jgi:predicted RNase H-like HicB family nuclease